MELKSPISNLLEQIKYVIHQLSPEQFVQPIEILSGSSIGQHNRHILEFFIELEKGYHCGIVNYDGRSRDQRIESELKFSLTTIQSVTDFLDRPDKALLLEAAYCEESASGRVKTNFYRELIYNLEHTVHHMAHIRIGLKTIPDIDIPDGFGIATSTLKYRKICAQ
jgi:hypothetical protein